MYLQMKTSDDVWTWLNEGVVQVLRAQRNYEGSPPYGLKGFLSDYSNRIFGIGIVRQTRSKPFTCRVPEDINSIIKNCSGNYDEFVEDTRNYCARWEREETFRQSCEIDEFMFTDDQSLKTYSYTGNIGSYQPGGYILLLLGRQDKLLEKIKWLQELFWIDEYTDYEINEKSLFKLCYIRCKCRHLSNRWKT